MEVGRDTFAPYTGELENFHPECMPFPFSSFFFLYFLFIYVRLTFIIIIIIIFYFIAIGQPSLNKFYRDRVHRACLYVDRSFHSLVTLQRLAG